jgi:uncharacterized membrane protein YqjE
MSAAKTEPTVGDLLGSLVRETGTLVHQEVRLASSEMSQKARAAAVDLGMIGAGAALAHAGLLSLMVVVAIGLSTWVPMWLAALILGIVAAGSGGVLIGVGLQSLRRLDPMPKETLETLSRLKPR